MLFRILILLTLCSPTFCLALDKPFSTLFPFFNKVNIVVRDNESQEEKSLTAILEKELIFQRKNNSQLKQFTTAQKIARFESRLLIERMQAQGYYDATIRFKINKDTIGYNINSGTRYTFDEISFSYPDKIPSPRNIIAIKDGMPIVAEQVLNAHKTLIGNIEQKYCLYNIDMDYQVLLDKEKQTGKLQFILEPSPSVRFGDIGFTGLETLDTDYLLKLITIKKDDCFNREKIENAKLLLMQSHLVANAYTEISEPDTSGNVDIQFKITERKHRSVNLGAGYQSDEGLGVSLGWEHRNLFSKAQRLKIEGKLAEKTQTFTAELTIPYFRHNRQSLSIYNEYEHSDTDAFLSSNVDIGIQLTRNFKRRFRSTLGAEFIFSRVIEDEITEEYTLFSIPLGLSYDRRDNILDPRKGWVLAGQVNGYWDVNDYGRQFNKIVLSASHYLSFDKIYWRPTLASRFSTGSIAKIDRDQIPANLRFYVGGGGSVRGYAFQSLGPTADDAPDGGLSFTEISNEIRIQFNTHWGAAFFIDGGYAYEQTSPQIGEELLWGAGFGLRYYTSFAPIRFDIATPLDKREGIDDDIQVYVSIGQSF